MGCYVGRAGVVHQYPLPSKVGWNTVRCYCGGTREAIEIRESFDYREETRPMNNTNEVTVQAPQTTLTATQVRALLGEVEKKEAEIKQVGVIKPGTVLAYDRWNYRYLILSADEMRKGLNRMEVEKDPKRLPYVGLNPGEINRIQTAVFSIDEGSGYTPVTIWEGR